MASSAAPPRPRHLHLLKEQLDGLAAWRLLRDREEAACSGTGMTREQRLDASRRLEALRRQEDALQEQLDRVQAWHAHGGSSAQRAVVAHHEQWLRARIVALLERSGVEVRAVPLDGAACIGVVAAEQPDLLVVSDPTTMMTAHEVVSACWEVSPRTRVVVQSETPEQHTGAGTVLSRIASPADVVAALLS